MRILLHHIPGATSFEDLKTSPDGVLLSTFKETATAYGLLESDTEWDNCLSEASIAFMPKQLHSLFVTILIFGQPLKPFDLWESIKVSWVKTYHEMSLWLIQCQILTNKDM